MLASNIKCPVCGSKTTLRTAKKGSNAGEQFYVCDRYPECKGKVKYQTQAEDKRESKIEEKKSIPFHWYVAQDLASLLPYLNDERLPDKQVCEWPAVMPMTKAGFFLGTSLALANSKAAEEAMICAAETGKWRSEFSELIADIERRNHCLNQNNVTFEEFFPEVIHNNQNQYVVLGYKDCITSIGQRILVGLMLGILFPNTALQMLNSWVHSPSEYKDLNVGELKVDDSPLLSSVEESYKHAQAIYEEWKGSSNQIELACNGHEQNLCKEESKSAEEHYALGEIYYGQRRFDEALQEYKEAIRLNPNYVDAHTNLGVTYAAQGKLDDAMIECKEAIRIDSNNEGAHIHLAIIYKDKGKVDDAIREYQQVLSINPNFAQIHHELGIQYIKQGKLDAAMVELRETLRLDPNHSDAHHNIGVIHANKGKFDEAMTEFKEAIRINPNHAHAHCSLGRMYIQHRKYDEVARENKEAIRIDPNYAEAHYLLGIAYHYLGKDNDTIKEHQEVLRLEPNHVGARQSLDILLRRRR
jgi:tetratricopeptide (TPR) repeat protein